VEVVVFVRAGKDRTVDRHHRRNDPG